MINNKLIGSLGILVLAGFSAFADSGKVCEDLYKLTCAPGVYDDGTGSGQNFTVFNSPYQRLIDDLAKSAKEKFLTALKAPENVYFRKIALSATGLSLNPVCDGAEDSPSPKCLDLLAEGVSDIAVKDLGTASQESDDEGPRQPLKLSLKDAHYLVLSGIYQGIAKELLQDLRQRVGSDEAEKKIKEKIVPQIKELLIAKIQKMVTDEKTKKNLIDKVAAVKFAGMDCSDKAGQTISAIFHPNAFKSTVTNDFKFCSGMSFISNSEFLAAFIVAHELSHTIDPCNVELGPNDYTFKYKPDSSRESAEAQFPVPGVLKCLRSDKSVEAKVAKDPATQGFLGWPLNPQSQRATGGYGLASPPIEKFESFCEKDQITEAFADWMAAEILPEYINKNFPDLTEQQKRFGYSNVFRGRCDSKDKLNFGGTKFDVHPGYERRTNYIVLTQPKIREQMGCPAEFPGHVHCSVSLVAPDVSSSDSSKATDTKSSVQPTEQQKATQ